MPRSSMLLVLAAAMLLALSRSDPALACSCFMPPPPKEALEESVAVFTGRVVDIAETTTAQGWGHRIVTLEVISSWKGAQTATIEVSTGMGGGDCGYWFVMGGEFLVYCGGEGGTLYTSICHRTTDKSGWDADLAELGPAPRRGGSGSLPPVTPEPTVNPEPPAQPAAQPATDPAEQPDVQAPAEANRGGSPSLILLIGAGLACLVGVFFSFRAGSGKKAA